MTSKQEAAEALAKWLDRLCVDWPPISYDWKRRDKETEARKKLMRDLAQQALNVIEKGVSHDIGNHGHPA